MTNTEIYTLSKSLQGKFVSLQTTHNTSTTLLQRELDKLRQEHQVTKIRLRELEMGNDDLERSERAVSSSLADAEAKYSRALEEKILLEHELLDKANLEEESQRLKDELRGKSSSHLSFPQSTQPFDRCHSGNIRTQGPISRPRKCKNRRRNLFTVAIFITYHTNREFAR